MNKRRKRLCFLSLSCSWVHLMFLAWHCLLAYDTVLCFFSIHKMRSGLQTPQKHNREMQGVHIKMGIVLKERRSSLNTPNTKTLLQNTEVPGEATRLIRLPAHVARCLCGQRRVRRNCVKEGQRLLAATWHACLPGTIAQICAPKPPPVQGTPGCRPGAARLRGRAHSPARVGAAPSWVRS